MPGWHFTAKKIRAIISFHERHKAGQDALPSQLYERKKPRQREMTRNSCREDESTSQPASRLSLNTDIIKHSHVPF